MSYPYRSDQIREILSVVKALRRPEVLVKGKPLPFDNYGERGKRIDLFLDLEKGTSLIDLRFHVRAPIFDAPETFEAALILANERVRGIGWHATGKKRLYGKQVIPKGWHQNVFDPNLSPNHPDRNRHLPIKTFEPTDLAAFFTEVAKLWHINLPIEESLL
jgi:hypothetical protein